MNADDQIREKLRKITALYEGAATAGERNAAAAAIQRLKRALSELPERPIEARFTISDPWQRQLFTALCRRYGLEPYRYTRQRHTTLNLKAPRSFIEETLWPEYEQLRDALHDYLREATERIIRDVVYRDTGEAPERG